MCRSIVTSGGVTFSPLTFTPNYPLTVPRFDRPAPGHRWRSYCRFHLVAVTDGLCSDSQTRRPSEFARLESVCAGLAVVVAVRRHSPLDRTANCERHSPLERLLCRLRSVGCHLSHLFCLSADTLNYLINLSYYHYFRGPS